ncbi:MAG: Tex-like N-terminal domain-containing protein [Caldisericia bacterium]|nr:Tex-like N-terminal domain-containing protein [Caldisericia bacterium]MDD4614801.1 Tex-like N-terminal domain-containing protein [Caldisericia bacterium]
MTNPDITLKKQDIEYISQVLGIVENRIRTALTLREEGCSLAFIARYRQEITKSLTDQELRDIFSHADERIALQERKEAILSMLQKKDRLHPLLQERFDAAQTITELEDLYKPYKQPRVTAAEKARKAGLEPLKNQFLKATRRLSIELSSYCTPAFPTEQSVWEGICSLIEEDFVLQQPIHQETYFLFSRYSSLFITAKPEKDPNKTYLHYYEFSRPIARCKPYQILAIMRGEKEKVLQIHFTEPDQWMERILQKHSSTHPHHPYQNEFYEVGKTALRKRILPSVIREIRSHLLEYAYSRSLFVFGKNLRSLLLQKPLGAISVVGLDPGFRMGSKWALVDDKGRVVETGTLYPAPPQNQQEETKRSLDALYKRHPFSFIAIGNGTASFEVSQVIAQWIQVSHPSVRFRRVSETGASIYSASEKAGKELPDIDVLHRGSVSIARRVQDPLSEFLKIPPESLGVGMYQHDIPPKKLKEYLSDEVSLVVNQVGVNVNTASVDLLQYISGLTPKMAERILQKRVEMGGFKNRSAFKEIKGIGEKTYEQCAGFCRIPNGDCVFDNTVIHPESYAMAQKILSFVQITEKEYANNTQRSQEVLRSFSIPDFLKDNPYSRESVQQILSFLQLREGDFRDTLQEPLSQSSCYKMEELHVGMKLLGSSTNITDFGIFFDIGCEYNGFLPLKMSVDQAFQWYPIGQSVEITITELDTNRKRILIEHTKE